MTTTGTITAEQIEAAKTSSGGWTRETLAAWGVPWPPPKGWKARLLSPDHSQDRRRDALPQRRVK